MTIDLTELERLSKEATPGPWKCDNSFRIGPTSYFDDQTYGMIIDVAHVDEKKNADFIIAIVNAFPSLISYIRGLESATSSVGWRLVPIEPTAQMLETADDYEIAISVGYGDEVDEVTGNICEDDARQI